MAVARALLVAALAPFAAGLTASGSGWMRADETWSNAVPAKKALVATVFEHTRVAPIDMMLSHQIRQLSASHKNVVQVAVINNKIPEVDNKGGTTQDPVIAQLQRSYGTTGNVQVVNTLRTESDLSALVELTSKVFQLKEGSIKSFAKKFWQQGTTTAEAKRQMAYFASMLQFVDMCTRADFSVELCINMEAESFLYRRDNKGLVELSSELFEQDEDVVALQPPTLCDYHQANHRPSWAKPQKWTESSFTKCVGNVTKVKPENGPVNMIFNRERLNAVLPLTISTKDLTLEHGFDHTFMAGMAKSRVSVKGMQCGHSFLIKPHNVGSCKALSLAKQVHASAHARDVEAGARAALDTVSGEYSLFDQQIIRGIEVLMSRLESGKLPTGHHDAVANKCQEMCPSMDRISQGLAW